MTVGFYSCIMQRVETCNNMTTAAPGNEWFGGMTSSVSLSWQSFPARIWRLNAVWLSQHRALDLTRGAVGQHLGQHLTQQ